MSVKNTKLRPGYKWPVSLKSAALELGVSINHLSQVLRKQRKSKRLMVRYQALQVRMEKGAA